MSLLAPSLERNVTGRTEFLEKIGLGGVAALGLHRQECLDEYPQFRYNIVTGTWSMVQEDLSAFKGKPRDYTMSKERDDPTHLRPDVLDGFDPFSLPNEHITPPEKMSFMDPSGNGKKMIRVFDNKFPVLATLQQTSDGPNVHACFDETLHPQISGVGICEVVVQHWKFGMCQALLKREESCLLWEALRSRAQALSEIPGVQYVQCFENHGIKSGGSLRHPHSQLLGLPFVPTEQKNRLDMAEKFWHAAGENVFDHILHHVADDKRGSRKLFEDEHVVGFVPWSVERSFEFWVVPRSSGANFAEASDNTLKSIAVAVSHCLRLLYTARDDPDYNVMVRTTPVASNGDADSWYRWHVCVLPSINNWGGVLSLGGFITSLPAETMAAELREQEGKALSVPERKSWLSVPAVMGIVLLCLVVSRK